MPNAREGNDGRTGPHPSRTALPEVRRHGAERERAVCRRRGRPYNEANGDKVREYNRAYHAANRDKLLERKRAYHAANLEKTASAGAPIVRKSASATAHTTQPTMKSCASAGSQTMQPLLKRCARAAAYGGWHLSRHHALRSKRRSDHGGHHTTTAALTPAMPLRPPCYTAAAAFHSRGLRFPDHPTRAADPAWQRWPPTLHRQPETLWH
jgi:hypothetical protein